MATECEAVMAWECFIAVFKGFEVKNGIFIVIEGHSLLHSADVVDVMGVC